MKNQEQFFTYGYKKVNEIYIDQNNNILKTNFQIHVDDVNFDEYIFYQLYKKYYNTIDLRKILNGTFG